MIELPDTDITSVNTAVDTDTNTTRQDAGELFSSTLKNASSFCCTRNMVNYSGLTSMIPDLTSSPDFCINTQKHTTLIIQSVTL